MRLLISSARTGFVGKFFVLSQISKCIHCERFKTFQLPKVKERIICFVSMFLDKLDITGFEIFWSTLPKIETL